MKFKFRTKTLSPLIRVGSIERPLTSKEENMNDINTTKSMDRINVLVN